MDNKMNWSKVSYIFFSLMSLTTTVGFIYEPYIIALILAVIVNIISTLLKIGVKYSLSTQLLASSFVADLHLIPALIIFIYSDNHFIVIALAVGAVVANLYSIVLTLIESAKIKEVEEY
jgi:hypothetical protein